MKASPVVALLLTFCIAGGSLPLEAYAGMMPTEAAVRDRIAAFVDREEVRAKLQAHGVTSAQVSERVAALTDDEAAEIAARIDELPAGGLGVLEAIVVVFLVLLLTDILGFTKVFPFTKAACDRGRC